jgi:hypothetical protein
MHQPYENRFHHKADFRVRYRFRTPEEGGRKTGSAFQGYRSDFSFVGVEGAFMIFPEFEDAEGNLILYNGRLVPSEGKARMWMAYEGRRLDWELHDSRERVQHKIFVKREDYGRLLQEVSIFINSCQFWGFYALVS